MEELMQYVWNHRLWDSLTPMQTVDGKSIRIIDPGTRNADAGPDFFNAKIYIDDQLWVGNVEIHVKAGDWYKHRHDADAAYDSIILHVVQVSDVEITRANGETIPQMILACNPHLNKHYNILTANAAEYTPPCANFIPEMPRVYLTDWIQRLGVERLYEKTERIKSLLALTSGDYDQASFATLARAMGSGINGDTFQALAMSTPLKILSKNRSSSYAVEGMLFGQAKLLENPASEPYYAHLQSEYNYYVHKYGLKQSQGINWKMSRMRPPALPHRRIALLAKLIDRLPMLTDMIVNIKTAQQARELFSTELTGYWADHYTFNSAPQPIVPHALSPATVNSLIINAVIPIQHCVALSRGDYRLADRALEMLTTLPRENNRIVNMFNDCGIECPDAFTSQAFIQLRNTYCMQRKCLYCRIGHRWLASQAVVRIGSPV